MMTRRDRAAMTLAYEQLRECERYDADDDTVILVPPRRAVRAATTCLYRGGVCGTGCDIADALAAAETAEMPELAGAERPLNRRYRLLRARLALLLRTLLRADKEGAQPWRATVPVAPWGYRQPRALWEGGR